MKIIHFHVFYDIDEQPQSKRQSMLCQSNFSDARAHTCSLSQSLNNYHKDITRKAQGMLFTSIGFYLS